MSRINECVNSGLSYSAMDFLSFTEATSTLTDSGWLALDRTETTELCNDLCLDIPYKVFTDTDKSEYVFVPTGTGFYEYTTMYMSARDLEDNYR